MEHSLELLVVAVFFCLVFRRRLKPFLQKLRTGSRKGKATQPTDSTAKELPAPLDSHPYFYEVVAVNLRDCITTYDFNQQLNTKLEEALGEIRQKGEDVTVTPCGAGTAVIFLIRYHR